VDLVGWSWDGGGIWDHCAIVPLCQVEHLATGAGLAGHRLGSRGHPWSDLRPAAREAWMLRWPPPWQNGQKSGTQTDQ